MIAETILVLALMQPAPQAPLRNATCRDSLMGCLVDLSTTTATLGLALDKLEGCEREKELDGREAQRKIDTKQREIDSKMSKEDVFLILGITLVGGVAAGVALGRL